MYQAVQFDIPFPPRVNPAVDAAEVRHRAWVREHGLVRSARAEEEYRSWRPAEMAGRWYLDADLPDLCLGADVFGWFMLFDDQFDGPLGERPDEVGEVVGRLVDVVREAPGRAPAQASPAERAFADLWRREREGMSRTWRERAGRNWAEFLATFVEEAANRSTGVPLSVPAYLRLRDKSGFMYPLLDTLERIGHYEVPPPLLDGPVLGAMRDSAVFVANTLNDVLGLEKEADQDAAHNLVLVLERERRCSRREAVDTARAMVRDRTDRFLAAEARLPGECDRLGLPPEARLAGYRHAADMRAAVRGTYDWCRTSPRYAGDRFDGYAEDVGHPEDIVGAARTAGNPA